MTEHPRLPDVLLIIEDSPVQAKIIRKQIELQTSFLVLTAHTMAEAQAILEERAADLFVAVVDLNLPDAPNGEAADLCLEWQVPSVVLTASFNAEIRTRFIQRNVVDYFFKGSIRDMDPMIMSLRRVYKNQAVTVLVVDDSRAQRGAVRHLLHVQRLSVLEAEDGQDALRVLAENPEVRLVITDFQMPHMNGLELVGELRKEYSRDKLGIIGISAVGSGPLTAQFLKLGSNDFITKPFEVEEFYWRVNQTLENLDMMQELTERKR